MHIFYRMWIINEITIVIMALYNTFYTVNSPYDAVHYNTVL